MNKRVLFLFIAVITTASYAQAQINAKIGIRAGLNLSNLYGANTAKFLKFKPGFQAGAVVDLTFNSDIFSIQPGIVFSQLGAQEKEDGEAIIMNLNYIQVPFNMQAKFGDFFLLVGPYLGYGVGVNVKEKADGVKLSESGSFKDAGFKSLNYGWGIGVGYQIGPVQAALNTQLSSNINDDSGNVYNIGLALTATYFF